MYLHKSFVNSEHSSLSSSLVVFDINFFKPSIQFHKTIKSYFFVSQKVYDFSIAYRNHYTRIFIEDLIIPDLDPFWLMVVLKCPLYSLNSIKCWYYYWMEWFWLEFGKPATHSILWMCSIFDLNTELKTITIKYTIKWISWCYYWRIHVALLPDVHLKTFTRILE